MKALPTLAMEQASVIRDAFPPDPSEKPAIDQPTRPTQLPIRLLPMTDWIFVGKPGSSKRKGQNKETGNLTPEHIFIILLIFLKKI